MTKKGIFILIILLSLSAALFGFGAREKESSANKTLLKTLDKYEKLWKSKGIKNYTEEVIYSRATFPPEHIVITVSNNSVQNWATNSPRRTFTDDFIESLTIENMFEKARKSLKTEDSPLFEFKILFNEELGHITNFSHTPVSRENENSPPPPFDRGYCFEVILLKTSEKNL